MSRSASACAPATASSPAFRASTARFRSPTPKWSRSSADAAKLNFTRTGAAELSISGEPAAVGQIVLADDAAILDLVPEAQRPSQLVVQSMTATLTTEARRLPAPVMRYLDRG